MIAWQNRPGALVCRYIKQCLANGESTSPPSIVINRNGQKSNGSEDVVEAGDLNGTTNGRGSRHSSGRARSTSESRQGFFCAIYDLPAEFILFYNRMGRRVEALGTSGVGSKVWRSAVAREYIN